jgi:hypothetical protein
MRKCVLDRREELRSDHQRYLMGSGRGGGGGGGFLTGRGRYSTQSRELKQQKLDLRTSDKCLAMKSERKAEARPSRVFFGSGQILDLIQGVI